MSDVVAKGAQWSCTRVGSSLTVRLPISCFMELDRNGLLVTLPEEVVKAIGVLSMPREPGKPTASEVIRSVCDHHEVFERELFALYGSRRLTTARRVAAFLLRQDVGLSYPEIGTALHKDHTTIMHHVRIAIRRLRDDPGGEFEKAVREVRHRYKQRGATTLPAATREQ